jgi:hypothetical protein
MKLLSVLVLGIVLASPATAQEAKKLIVGKWESTLKSSGNADIKLTAEFKPDGKLIFEVKDIKVTGTYSFDKDQKKLETETTFEGQTKKLTQDVSVTKETLELKADGQAFVFKRAN